MKYLLMFLFVIALAIPKAIHKNSKNISTEKIHFQETFVQKGEDGICHFTSRDDKTIPISKPYSSLDECLQDGGYLVKPYTNNLK